MREEVRAALDRAESQYGIVVSGPEDELDRIDVHPDGSFSITSERPPRLTVTDSEGGIGSDLWWHVYIGRCPHWGGSLTLILGESTMHPEQLVADPTRLDLPSGMSSCDCRTQYLRSYDHEPTDADRRWIEDEIDRLLGDAD